MKEEENQESEIPERILTNLHDPQIKQNEGAIAKLNSDLESEKELTRNLQERIQELEILEGEHKSQVKQQEEAIEPVVATMSPELERQRKLAKELEQKLQQQLRKSQILEEECRRLEVQDQEKKEANTKLASDLKNEKKRVQELKQRVAELQSTPAFRSNQDAKEKDKRIKKVSCRSSDEQTTLQKKAEEVAKLYKENKQLKINLSRRHTLEEIENKK